MRAACVLVELSHIDIWLDRDKNTLSGKVIALPAKDDIDFEIAENLIVELYSK